MDDMVNVRWITADTGVAELRGDLNLYTVPQVRKRLLKICKKHLAVLAVDLTQLSSVDSAGIAALVEVLRAVRERGGSLRLSGLNEKTKQVLRLTRLDQLFDSYETLDNALAVALNQRVQGEARPDAVRE